MLFFTLSLKSVSTISELKIVGVAFHMYSVVMGFTLEKSLRNLQHCNQFIAIIIIIILDSLVEVIAIDNLPHPPPKELLLCVTSFKLISKKKMGL